MEEKRKRKDNKKSLSPFFSSSSSSSSSSSLFLLLLLLLPIYGGLSQIKQSIMEKGRKEENTTTVFPLIIVRARTRKKLMDRGKRQERNDGGRTGQLLDQVCWSRVVD